MAEVLERIGQLIPDLLVDRLRNANPVRLGQSFEARGDIDPVAVNVFGLGDDITEIDADTQADALILGDTAIAAAHAALSLQRAEQDLSDGGDQRTQSA